VRNMKNLFQLSLEYENLTRAQEEYAERNAGLIDESIEAQILKCRDYIPEIIKDMKNHAAMSEMLKREIDTLTERKKAHDNKAQRCKDALLKMCTVGEKLEYECGAVSWRKSSSVVINMENLLPESAFKVVKSVSKDTVKDLIKAGQIAEEIAHIEERQNIQVK